MDDNKLAHFVNDLTHIATTYATHQSLRERISRLVVPEIESLRQRVAKLESIASQINSDWIPANRKLSQELAALKAGQSEWEDAVLGQHSITYTSAPSTQQGEPVAWMQSDHLDKLIHNACGAQSMLARCSNNKLQSDFIPLFTSAPSIPEDEIESVRMFLMYYGANGGITVNAMRENLSLAGFDGYWPGWVEEAENKEHLTKAGAQSWLRHLFLSAAPKPGEKE